MRRLYLLCCLTLLTAAATGCVTDARPFTGMGALEPGEGVVYGRVRGAMLGHDIIPLVSQDEFYDAVFEREAICYTIRLRNDEEEYRLMVPASGVFAFAVKAGTYEVLSSCYATWPEGAADVAGVSIHEQGVSVVTHPREGDRRFSKRRSFVGGEPYPLDGDRREITVAEGDLVAYGDLIFSLGVRPRQVAPGEAAGVAVAEEDARSVAIAARDREGASASAEGFYFDLDAQRVEQTSPEELRTAVTEAYPELPVEE